VSSSTAQQPLVGKSRSSRKKAAKREKKAPEKISDQGMNLLSGLYKDEPLLLQYSQQRWDGSDSMVSQWEQST
jgi:hypothetical protein